jgi:hypothetical protein
VVIAHVFLGAFGLNALWEIGQLPLCAGCANVHLPTVLRHCAWYTFSDATLVPGLYALGAVGHGTWGSGLRLQGRDGLWLPFAGILVTISMERLAWDVGRWQSGPDMPLLPGVSVRILPVVQMGAWPWLSVCLASRLVPMVVLATSNDSSSQRYTPHLAPAHLRSHGS